MKPNWWPNLLEIKKMTRIKRKVPTARTNQPNKKFKMTRKRSRKRTQPSQTLTWMMLLKSCKSSTERERREWTVRKVWWATHLWRKRVTSKQKSKKLRDKRERKESSGRRWPRYSQIRITLFGVLLTRPSLSTMLFWLIDKILLRRLVFWINKTKSLRLYSISTYRLVLITICKYLQPRSLD